MVACTHEQGEARAGGRRSETKGKDGKCAAKESSSGRITFSAKARAAKKKKEGGGDERPLNRGPRNWLIGAPVIALMRLAGATAAKSSSPKNAMRQVEAEDPGEREP